MSFAEGWPLFFFSSSSAALRKGRAAWARKGSSLWQLTIRPFLAAVFIAASITLLSVTSWPSSVISGTWVFFSWSRWLMVFPSKRDVMLTLWITWARPVSSAFWLLARASFCEETTGDVFGIRTRVPNPPAAAAWQPETMSSFCVWPGSRKWACMSMKLGSRVSSFASNAGMEGSASSFFSSVDDGMEWILPFFTRIAPFLSVRASTMCAL